MNTDYDQLYIEDMVNVEQRFLKQLGQQIRYQRRLNCLTQEQLGELAGVSYKYLGEIERGTKTPSIVILHHIAKGLGQSLSELLGFSQIPNPDHQILIRSVVRLLEGRKLSNIKKAERVLRVFLDNSEDH
jgi:XRE family transcriptional regulator, regulator of sulfur utilization